MAELKAKQNVLAFKYDRSEQLSEDGYLTPVYFNKQVLIRYLYDSRFYCDFVSETYGTIGNNDFDIQFGINKNGSVIIWLGDIMNRIPQKEQLYLLVENKEPEREIASEFYNAQINAEFTYPPLEIRTLNNIEKLNSAFEAKYACFLYKERSIEERIDEARRYKRIIMNDIDDFKCFITELNEIINESTNNKSLRHLLDKNGISYDKGSKGNKLLEKVYTHLLGDKENAIAPFFYLYDLRLWAAHTPKEEVLKKVTTKLNLEEGAKFKDILHNLLLAINQSSKKLIQMINKET